MSEPVDDAPLAVAERRRWPAAIWLVPLVAVGIGVWLAFGVLAGAGPTIRITFRTAEGLEAGKTRIKFRELDVGTVRSVALAPGQQSVVVTAEMNKDAEPFLNADTRFWVVRPRFAGGQISGIGTLLSGSYIGMATGSATSAAREFTGLEVPPIVTGGLPGRQFVLHAAEIGMLSVGSPVYFRQIQVGQLLAYELDRDGRGVTLRVFVEAPFDRFVVNDTRFWNAGGVDLQVDANGVQLRTESLVSLLVGGVAFETPPGVLPDTALAASAPAGSASAPAAKEREYTLWSSRAEALKDRDAVFERFVLMFDHSVRGLQVGAPVDFRGLVVGEVTHIGLEFDEGSGRYRIPVEINFYPQRLTARYRNGSGPPLPTGRPIAGVMSRFVERGFRAQLRSANLLTGQLYVALDFMRDAPKAPFDASARPLRLPTVPGDLETLQASLGAIVRNLEKVPFDRMAQDLRTALATLNRALATVDGAVARADAKLVPELQRTLEQARATLAAGETAATSLQGAAVSLQGAASAAQSSLGSDSAVQTDLRSTLREVSRAADQVRNLSDYLSRHPEALIRGKTETPR